MSHSLSKGLLVSDGVLIVVPCNAEDGEFFDDLDATCLVNEHFLLELLVQVFLSLVDLLDDLESLLLFFSCDLLLFQESFRLLFHVGNLLLLVDEALLLLLLVENHGLLLEVERLVHKSSWCHLFRLAVRLMCFVGLLIEL